MPVRKDYAFAPPTRSAVPASCSCGPGIDGYGRSSGDLVDSPLAATHRCGREAAAR